MLHWLLAPLVLLSSLFHSHDSNLNHMIDRVSASIVFVTGTTETMFGTAQYSCTGFVVMPKIVQTAKHCVGTDMKVDGKPVRVIKVSSDMVDLALLAVDTDKAPLALEDVPVHRFEHVYGIGYAFGWDTLTVMADTINLAHWTPDVDQMTPGLFVIGGYIGGMSGGPVVDEDGHVLGIVQQSVDKMGYGVETDTILNFMLGI